MFVAKRRLILKTCGTTTPLQCLEPLLDLVEEHTGFDEVEVLRLNFLYHQQIIMFMYPLLQSKSIFSGLEPVKFPG